MNEVFISGKLVSDPVVRIVGGSMKVATTSIAVKDGGKKETTSFYDVDFWQKSAELVGSYFVKGNQISLRGHLKQDTYEKDGKKVSRVKIVADEILNLPVKEPVAVNNDYVQENLPF